MPRPGRSPKIRVRILRVLRPDFAGVLPGPPPPVVLEDQRDRRPRLGNSRVGPRKLGQLIDASVQKAIQDRGKTLFRQVAFHGIAVKIRVRRRKIQQSGAQSIQVPYRKLQLCHLFPYFDKD